MMKDMFVEEEKIDLSEIARSVSTKFTRDTKKSLNRIHEKKTITESQQQEGA